MTFFCWDSDQLSVFIMNMFLFSDICLIIAATLCFSGYSALAFEPPSEGGAEDLLVSDLTALASGNKKNQESLVLPLD